MTFEDAETTVLDPANWDRVFAGELYFDALRAMLVRFPGMADQVHAQLAEGYRIERIELVLDWEKQEGPRPERGRHGWGAEGLYEARPGEWNVTAHALKQPWSVQDPDIGPTFDAYVRGLAYWERGGARADGVDRHTVPAGPLPLHAESTTARLDLTHTLEDASLGDTRATRLRTMDACGFQIHKHEIRDMRYRHFWAYDWAVSIGYMRIWVKPPRLEVTLRRAPDAQVEDLPETVSINEFADHLRAEDGRGASNVAPPPNLAERAQQHWRKPEGMPDWQWERIGDLRALRPALDNVTLALGRSFNFSVLLGDDPDAYLATMRELLRMPPRTWQGHLSSDFALLPAAYADLLTPAALDHLKLYWKAWLHPETRSRDDIGGGTHRGGPSYFRGYTHGGGTMNFGHNAVMGALLGAQFIDAEYPLADATGGVENLLRRRNGLGTGAHQEIGDTYYQALTIAAAGAIAKYAEDPVTRMMGQFHRNRLLEPLISMYHPGLRRMTHPMGRGSYFLKLAMQEGPYHVLHTLSPAGVLMHLDEIKPQHERDRTPKTWGTVHGLNILGDEGPPKRIAVISPWTEPYLADTMGALMDGKSFPWRIHARDYSPGCRPGGWHVNYLSQHYALASRDNANYNYGVTSIAAQWRRSPETVQRMQDLTTMVIDFSSNRGFTRPGMSMGEFGIVHHDNKLLGMKALPSPERIQQEAGKDTAIHSLHTSALLLAFGDTAQRDVWINDNRIDDLSGARPDPGDNWQNRIASSGAVATARDGDRITISDGVTFLGLIPIVANPLDRQRHVEIAFEYPFILIHAFIYDNADAPLDPNTLQELERKPTAGFAVELGDITQYPSFRAFREHMNGVTLNATWTDNDDGVLNLEYQSGEDLLDMAYDPTRYPARERRINGAWPYLPDGIMRASGWAVQGSTGELTLHGAVLRSKPGQHAYLQAAPATDTYIAYNPTPDLTEWSLNVPGGVHVRADGQVGMLRVVVKPTEGRVWVDQIYRPEQLADHAEGLASGLLLFGFDQPPEASVNDRAVEELEAVEVDGRTGYRLRFQ